MGSREKNSFVDLVTRYGYGEQARHIQELYLSGRQKEAALAIPNELIDLTCICGPAERVRARLASYDEAGVDTLILIPAALGGEAQAEQLRLVADLASDYLTPGTWDNVAWPEKLERLEQCSRHRPRDRSG